MIKSLHTYFLTIVVVFLLGTSMFQFLEGPIGRLEGEIYPVVNPSLTITAYEERLDGTIRLSGFAPKVRDCGYVNDSLEWYFGTPDRHVGVTSYFEDQPSINRPGVLSWEAIIVGLSEERIKSNSFATVKHDCGWPWLTVSTFYSSDIGLYNGREEITAD